MFCTVFPDCSCIPFPPAWDSGIGGMLPLTQTPAGVGDLESCAALAALPWEEKQDQLPKGRSDPSAVRASLVCGFLSLRPGGCSRSPEGPSFLWHAKSRVFPPSADSHDGEDHLPLQLLKAQPCYVYLRSQPRGPPERGGAWACLWANLNFAPIHRTLLLFTHQEISRHTCEA